MDNGFSDVREIVFLDNIPKCCGHARCESSK